MLTVSGRIQGLAVIYFEPTQERFRDAYGTVVISKPLAVRPDAKGAFSAHLFSYDELQSFQPSSDLWLWKVTEMSWIGGSVKRLAVPLKFTFSAYPGEYSYAQLRTDGEGLP